MRTTDEFWLSTEQKPCLGVDKYGFVLTSKESSKVSLYPSIGHFELRRMLGQYRAVAEHCEVRRFADFRAILDPERHAWFVAWK